MLQTAARQAVDEATDARAKAEKLCKRARRHVWHCQQLCARVTKVREGDQRLTRSAEWLYL